MKVRWVLVWLLGLPSLLYGQAGVPQAFSFLEVPGSARQVALGANNLTVNTTDVNMIWANPATLGSAMHQQFSVNYQAYPQGMGLYQIGYALSGNRANLALGLQSWNFGEIDAYDASGGPLGRVAVAAQVLQLSGSTTIEPFTLGANLKVAINQFATGGAVAIVADIAGLYQHPTQDLRVGIALKNLGAPISGFQGLTVPWDVQVGASYKPEHMPFRISLTAQRLHTWQVLYFDSTRTTQADPRPPGFGAQALGHLIVGIELPLGDNVTVMSGYNFRRRYELQLPDGAGASGFSLGGEARIKMFTLAYGVAFNHIAGGTHQFTWTLDVNQLWRRRSKPETTDPTVISNGR